MKAIVYHNSGSGDVLKLEEIEKPVPRDDEVLVKVRAASVNPFDVHMLRHPWLRRVLAKLAKINTTRPGRDVAGVIYEGAEAGEAVGRNVKQFKPGDEVFGSCSGAFAEYACVRESDLAMKPLAVSFEQAASMPIAGLTALQGLRDQGQIQPGQKVLINGAAGGVGTFAVQIAKSLGAEVTGVCSTRNVEMVRSIGADKVIDYTREDFTSSGQHYDLFFDLVANHSFSERRRVLTPRGIYIGAGMVGRSLSIIGLLTSGITESILALFVSQKFGSYITKLNQKDLTAIGALMEQGKVTPVIDRRYSLSEAAEAVRYVEEGHARGKVIIDFVPPHELPTAPQSEAAPARPSDVSDWFARPDAAARHCPPYRTQLSSHQKNAMPETSIPTPPGFAELPKAEQVRYLQALWDQISEHPDEIPVPESHLQLAEERLRRYRESPSSARPAFEVIDRLSVLNGSSALFGVR